MGGQAANQAVDPAIQQITEFINTSVNDGQDPTDVVMSLMEQEVDQQIIAQAFMQLGYQEEDVVALFQQVQEKSQPAPPSTPEEQTRNPQEMTRNETMAEQSQEGEMPMAQSGIEIKPENEGKFTKWATARGMSVQEAASKVMSNTDKYPPSVVKMANFAKNAAGWNKAQDGNEIIEQQTNQVIPDGMMLNPAQTMEFRDVNQNGIEDREEGIYKDRDYIPIPKGGVGPGPVQMPMIKTPSSGIPWPKTTIGKNGLQYAYQEGGEFEPHFMYKGERKIRAKDMATHLRLKDAGYMPEAQTGQEIQRQNRPTFAPNYVNPLAFESGTDFSLGKAATVLGSGYNAMFAGDENEDGTKDGSFRDWSRKRKENQLNKGNYYDYKINVDPNDPNSYAGDNLDLFNASKGKDGLRTLQQYTEDLNENSYANFNSETGNYDTFRSSRGPEAYDYTDRFGTRKRSLLEGNKSVENARAGQNLNYFNSVDDATRQELLDFGNATKAGMPKGTTLSIDPVTGETSYMNPETDNPNQYNTMMGYNKSGATGVNTPAVFNPIVPPTLPAQSMIPTNQNGQVFPGLQNSQKPGPRADNPPSFKEWQIQNAIRLQSTPLSEQHSLYNSTTFKYGGDLPKAQFGPPSTGPGSGMGSMYLDQFNLQNVLDNFDWSAETNVLEESLYKDPAVKRTGKFEGGLDRFMNSNGMNAYADMSEFAVNAADVVNDFYNDRNVNQARVDNYNQFAVADNIYGTYEDPFNKRGKDDVNKGTAGSEGDRTTGLYLSKKGGEINVDSNLLAKLIAAGADIEIL